jgi:enoyl-CoA hydratase/carnithine racemase
MSTKASLTPPAHSNELKVSIPEAHVLLLTFNRPASLNAMSPNLADDIRSVLDWFDDQPDLW